jgi:hypothetical protein
MPEFSPNEIANREHIAPDKTGDNIAAKKVAVYVDSGGSWVRMTQPGGASGGDGAILDGVTSSTKATVKSYTNANPLTVRLSDTNGDYVAAGAGTQYTEDAAAAADPVGGMLLARRKDTLSTTEVSADGDNIALNATNKGQLHVKLADTVTVDNSGVTQPVSAASLPLPSGAATSANQPTVYTEDAASAADPVGLMNMAVRRDTLSTTEVSADGDNIALKATNKGQLHVKLADTVTVDGSGVTQPVSLATNTPTLQSGSTTAVTQATGTNLHTVVDSGTVTTVSTVTNLSQLGGTAIAMNTGVRTAGTQRVTIATDDVVPVTGTFWQATQPVSGTITASNAAGDVAHDGVDSGNPVKVGGKATNVEPTAVSATGDRTNFITDMVGKQITLPYANPENFVSGAITTAMTGTTSTSLVAAPAAGLRNYLTTIIVSNAHATVGTDIVIQDGSGGTTLLTIPAAAVYGGAVITLPTPLRQPTTATAIFCANVTTGASTKVSAVGYKGV